MKGGKTLVELAMEIERRQKAKQDYVVDTRAVAPMVGDGGKMLLSFGNKLVEPNAVAHAQIGSALEIPKAYYDKMLAEAPALLAENVGTWFKKNPAKRMLRTLEGVGRAWLSDKYRPLENEDLAAATIPVIQELGLDVMSSEITDRRLFIKAVDPRVTRELQAIGGKFGDGQHKIARCLAPAITVSNSEVGMGALSVLGGVYDKWCSNLATFGEQSMRKYHVGARHDLGEDTYTLLSEKTREKTDEALWMQVGDVVRAAFDRARFDATCERIAETTKDEIEGDPVKVVQLSSKKWGLTEGEGKSVLRHLIEGGSLTRFGLFSAVTRAAQDDDVSYDRASELERLGGTIVELKQEEWKVLAKAA